MSLAFLLLLPVLLSGYLFSQNCCLTRFRVVRLEGYHLYFRCALSGSIFFLLAMALFWVMVAYLPESILSVGHDVKRSFDRVFSTSGSAVFGATVISLLSILIAYVLLHIVNRIVPKEYAAFLAIQYDDLELLIYRAVTQLKAVSITVENGKVYVGWILFGFEANDERKFIRMLPIMSGYRDEVTKKVSFTTFYEPIIEAITQSTDLEDSDFEVILPVSDLKSANLFDAETYLKFQAAYYEQAKDSDCDQNFVPDETSELAS